jgi:acyl carrier protein
MQAEEVETLILRSLHNLNEELPDERKVEVSSSTVLFGVDAEIDSLALVSIIMDIELVLSSLGLDIALADERAMNRDVPPITSVQTLKDYIMEIASES